MWWTCACLATCGWAKTTCSCRTASFCSTHTPTSSGLSCLLLAITITTTTNKGNTRRTRAVMETVVMAHNSRLELPGDVVQDGREHAVFDREHDRLSVWIPKAHKGEHFDGLDMLTRLLARPKDLPPASTAIQELDCPDAQQEERQQAPEQQDQDRGRGGQEGQELVFPHYGFGNAFSRFFEALQEDLPEIIDLAEPDVVAAADRTRLREQQEDSKFEVEHFMFVHPSICLICSTSQAQESKVLRATTT